MSTWILLAERMKIFKVQNLINDCQIYLPVLQLLYFMLICVEHVLIFVEHEKGFICMTADDTKDELHPVTCHITCNITNKLRPPYRQSIEMKNKCKFQSKERLFNYLPKFLLVCIVKSNL